MMFGLMAQDLEFEIWNMELNRFGNFFHLHIHKYYSYRIPTLTGNIIYYICKTLML
jgi:hypothetical protein